jgi:hypothetical protein
MIVSLLAQSHDTTAIFTATTGTVISIGPSYQPFNVSTSTPILFEIWNDSTTSNPSIYVKKLSEGIAEAVYAIPALNATSINGGSAVFNRSLKIGGNTFTTGTANISGGSFRSTIMTDGSHYASIALVPNIVRTRTTTLDIASNSLTLQIAVQSTAGIKPGATVYFLGTNTPYTVASIAGPTTVVLTNTYNVNYSGPNQPITFINPQFSDQPTYDQPTVVQMASTGVLDSKGSITSDNQRNLKGTIYADSTSLQVTFANPDGVNTNTFSISISTSTTATASTNVATVGFLNNLMPRGSVIMWYGSQDQLWPKNPDSPWVLCDGITVCPNGDIPPDLRNRFSVGADSEENNVQGVKIPTTTIEGQGKDIGGTSTSIVVAHTHQGTGTTVAVSDPGHQHASVGPNQVTGSTPNPNGPYGNAPLGSTWWGFNETTVANAVQWYTSKEYTFQDQQGSTPYGGGVVLETNITIESTGTDTSENANLPPYTALYYIYKWIG